MSSLLEYLELIRHFVQRSPILFGSTLGLVAIVGVLLVVLPSSEVKDAEEPSLEKFDARKLQNETVVSTGVGETARVQSIPGKVATDQERPGDRPTQKSTVRGTPESPGAATRATAGGGFTVQVGSFASEQAARQMSLELKASGYPAFVKAAQIPGKGRTFRVRVGLFASREEARRYGDRLVKREKTLKSVLATIND
jgi:cell division septation protein DedD